MPIAKRPLLEIACHSLHSALAAQQGGADRIELCSALSTGGLTPSPGLVQAVLKHVHLPIHVLIRPRIGNFIYSKEEVETMVRDIHCMRDSGVAGVVVGCLTQQGSVDEQALAKFKEAASSLTFTFHRAFDFCTDMSSALEILISHRINRILSSGGAASAELGRDALGELLLQARNRIEIMPGAGINSINLEALMAALGASSYHASAKSEIQLPSLDGPDLGGSQTYHETSRSEVAMMMDIIKKGLPTCP